MSGNGGFGLIRMIAVTSLIFAMSACDKPTSKYALSAQPSPLAATSPKTDSWSNFAGTGWTVESAIEGRLTPGGKGDVVLVLRGNDPAKRIANDGLGEPILDLNPRKLTFLERRGAGYRKAAEIAGFLPSAGSEESPCLADPLEEGGVSISGNVLQIELRYWLSCGSYGVTRETYKFRKENGRFRLIGYDGLEFSRSTHDQDTISVNFLTGKKEVSHSDGDEEAASTSPKQISRIGPEKFWLDTLPQDGCQANWCRIEQ